MTTASRDLPELPHPQRPCPVCRGAQRELMYRQRFAEFSSEGLLAGYDVCACRHCGLCFADRIPRQDSFDRYYEVMSKYEAPRPPSASTDPNVTRLMDVVPFIERAAGTADAILEIGCGSGQLLNLLRGRGFGKLRGIDPSPRCAQIAREHYGLDATSATFSTLNPAEPEADVIVLIAVLEHVRDLEQPLMVLRRMVPVGGRVFITVPDASHYVDGIDAPFQEFSVEHINYFGPASLTNLMQTYGFEPLFCESADVRAHTSTVTPVIHGAFTKRALTHASRPDEHPPDQVTAAALRRYIAKSQREHERVLPVLHGLTTNGRPLVIWGAGAHTLRLLAQDPLASAHVDCIIDSNPRYQGKRVGNIPVIAPSQPPDETANILISSRVYQAEICDQIREKLGWPNPLVTLY